MHVSPARQLPITQYLRCVSIKTRAFSRANLLADMVTQVVAKPTIRAEARPSRQPEPTDNTVSLLACRSDRSREVWCHRFADQDCFDFIRLILLGDTIGRLSFHECSDRCAEIVAMHCQRYFQLFVRLGWSKNRAKHIHRAHICLLGRLYKLGRSSIESAMATVCIRGCSGSSIIIDNPINVIAPKVTIYILCGARICRELVCIEARTMRYDRAGEVQPRRWTRRGEG